MRLVLAALACLAASPAMAQSEIRTKNGSVATLRALDTITGLRSDHEITVGQTVEVARLKVTVDACKFPSNNPSSDAFAFLRIYDRASDEARFEGWMIASSPALSALEHPRYDVWVLKCS